MISTLQKLAGIGSDIGHTSSSNINFNANLPVSIEVLQQIDSVRYRLKIGRKELTTKSSKNLKEGEKYWANFSEGNGGVLTISNLWKQPKFFEQDAYFLPTSLEKLFESKNFSYTSFKKFSPQTIGNRQQQGYFSHVRLHAPRPLQSGHSSSVYARGQKSDVAISKTNRCLTGFLPSV